MLGCQGGVQKHGVIIIDRLIIHAVHKKNRWTILRDMFFQRERVSHRLFELPPDTECAAPRSAMCIALVGHCDDRINGTNKSRLVAGSVMSRTHHSEVTSGRETHHSDTGRVNM